MSANGEKPKRAKERKNRRSLKLLHKIEDKNDTTVFDSIVNDLRVGGYVRDAAARAGTTASAVFRWIAQGEEWAEAEVGEIPDQMQIYRAFYDAVESARADAVMASIAVIRRAAQGTPAEYSPDGHLLRAERRPEWTAAAWYLERTRPAEFGRQDRHEVTGRDGAALSLTDLEAAVDAEDSS